MESINCAEGSSEPAAKPSHDGCTQEDLFHSRLGLTEGYVAVAPFGGGKTSLAKMEATRIAEEAKESGKPSYLIICLWKENCPLLIHQYKKFVSELASCDNLQVKVCSKSELEKDYKLNFGSLRSTNEINMVCKAITDVEDTDVYLIVDEMCVEYILQKIYRIQGSPNELVGNMPFIHGGSLYPWSGLLPGKIRLLLFVTSESEFFVEKDKIKKGPPAQGPVQTFFLPRSLRPTQRQHKFLTFMEDKMEKHVRQYGGYLLPPHKEIWGGKTDGQHPEWIPVVETDHLLCEIGCKSCLLVTIIPSLAAKMRELEDQDEITRVARSEVAMVILGTSSNAEKERSRAWMKEHFPDTVIYMDQEMAGIEMPVVISISNLNYKTLITAVPFSLSRTKQRCLLFCNDYMKIFEEASRANLIKKKTELAILNNRNLESSENPSLRLNSIDKVKEILPFIVSNAWDMPPESIEKLSQNLGLGNEYRELMHREKEATRGEVVENLLENWISREEGVSLLRLKIALRAETVKLDKIVLRIEAALRTSLVSGVQQMKKLIIKNFFSPAEIMNIAYEFGFKQRHLNTRMNPKKPLNDEMALICCLDIFVDQSPSDFSSIDLSDKLKEMSLPDAADEVLASAKQPMPGNDTNIIDRASDITRSTEKPYDVSIINVAFPVLLLLSTFTMMFLLRRKGLNLESGLSCLLMWIPSLLVISLHILEHLDNHLMIIGKKKTLLGLLLLPISEIAAFVVIADRQKKFQGKTMRKYYLLKILELAETLQICNSFTSLALVILILILFNTGKLNLEFNAVNVVSMICGSLHVSNLMVTLMRSWFSSYKFLTTSLLFFPLCSSVILRILPAVLFLTSGLTPFAFSMISFLIVILPINYVLEWKMSKDESDTTAVDDVKSQPAILFRATMSWIFPLPSKELTKSCLLLSNMQLIISNTVCFLSIFLSIKFTPELSFSMMPMNLLRSTPITAFLLMLHASVVYGVTTFLLKKLEIERESGDTNEDTNEDATSNSSTFLLNEDNGSTWKKRRILLTLWALACVSSLIASISTAPFLMTTVFNTCPSLQTSSHSTANITCDNPMTIRGTSCNLSCTEGYPSAGSLTTICTWMGTWSNPSFECSSPSLLILGDSAYGKGDQLTAELYNPDEDIPTNTSTIQPLPHEIIYSASGFVDGSVILCGGYDRSKNRVTAFCYTHNGESSWSRSAPLLQERWMAASTVILDGSALWVLGGIDTNFDADTKTMILQHGNWYWGPDITSKRVAPCAVTLRNGDVILSGGYYGTNLATVEKFSFNKMSWDSLPALHHPRCQHRCAHVYVNQDGVIDANVFDTTISTVIIAGGNTLDSSLEGHPVTSVEMFISNQWIILPPLPALWDGVMSFPTALKWFPGHGLFLVGGCFQDWQKKKTFCTTHVWNLQWVRGTPPNLTYCWQNRTTELGVPVRKGNAVISIPQNFFK